MTSIKSKKISITRNLILIVLTVQISSCTGQVKEKSVNDKIEYEISNQQPTFNQSTTFPQIHTNLNGMVREFVRTIYQDKKGNYWFGTNDNGIIRYDGDTLERMTIEQNHKWVAVREIVEDKVGNIWFGTSSGLVKYDGEKFELFSSEVGLQDQEIWGLTIDRNGLIWVGSIGGVSKFDGKTYTNFTKDGIIEGVETYNFCEDSQGNIWFSAEGYGVYRYDGADFTQFTTDNGLASNVVQSIFEDNKGQVWFGTWQGISLYDGQKFMNAKDKEPWTN